MGNYHLQGKDVDFSAETKHTPGTFRDTSEQLQNGKLMVYDGVNLGQYMQKKEIEKHFQDVSSMIRVPLKCARVRNFLWPGV